MRTFCFQCYQNELKEIKQKIGEGVKLTSNNLSTIKRYLVSDSSMSAFKAI